MTSTREGNHGQEKEQEIEERKTKELKIQGGCKTHVSACTQEGHGAGARTDEMATAEH
jgi:hypothetical protein